MQSVSEFVEGRLDLVPRQQRRLSLGRSRDVEIVADDDASSPSPRSLPDCVHPGAASLAGAREIVPHEKACESAVLAANLPYFDALGVSVQVRPRGERQPVKPVRGVEDASFDDVRQLQVGCQRLVVQLELLAGERVAEVKPVGRGDRRLGVCFKRLMFGFGVALGRFDHRLEKAVNGPRRSGRFLGGDILGVGGVAENLGLFCSKSREREDDAAGVRRRVASVAPRRRSLEDPFANIGARKS